MKLEDSRICVFIPHYGNNHNYLKILLEEYEKIPANEIIINIYCTDKEISKIFSPQKIGIHFSYFDESIKEQLVHEYKDDLKKYANDFDLYIYSEDDILIKEKNIKNWLIESKRKFKTDVCGFLRYEEKDNKKHFIDLNLKFPTIEYKLVSMFTVYNLHQGCWILTKDQLNLLIKENKILDYSSHSDYGKLEQGATWPFLTGKLSKFYPKDFENLMIHHLPNKYINMGGVWETPGTYTEETLRKELNRGG